MSMKRCVALLASMILLASMLSGCLASDDPNPETLPTKTAPTTTAPTQTQPTTVPTQPTTVPTQPEGPETEIAYNLNRTSLTAYWAAEAPKWPLVIKSMEELRNFAKTNFVTYMLGKEEFVDFYDDAFFDEHTLLVVCIRTPADLDYELQSCMKMTDGTYAITLKRSEGGGGNGSNIPCYHIMFIGIKDDVGKDAVVEFCMPDPYVELVKN